MKKIATTHSLKNIPPELYEAIAKDKGSRFPAVNKNDVIIEALMNFYGLFQESLKEVE